jgi:peptide/nickel transport system permease protein
MLSAIVRRVASSVVVLVLVVTIVFILMRSLGDPAAAVLGDSATADSMEKFRHAHGLDLPLWQQWIDYMKGALHGDFGHSFRYGSSAMQVVLDRLPATLTLCALTMLLTVLIAIPVGIYSGLKPNSWLDSSSRVFAVLGQSAPIFWTAILLILVFSVKWRLFPAVGAGGWSHLALPTISLTIYSLPLVLRMSRSSVMEVMNQDFIRIARAKGISERRLIFNHGLRNASVPIITVVGLRVGHLVGGTIVTEQVFAYPGMGRLAISSMQLLDFPVMQAFVLVLAALIVLVNLMVDISYELIDPRIRIR